MSLLLLRVEGVEEERDAALSVLLHITDADRIIGLELTSPKRFSNAVFISFGLFVFFLLSDVMFSIGPLDMGSLEML